MKFLKLLKVLITKFLKNGILKSINQFEYKKHQKPFLKCELKEYINNFILYQILKLQGKINSIKKPTQ